jgi:hypothetical protein
MAKVVAQNGFGYDFFFVGTTGGITSLTGKRVLQWVSNKFVTLICECDRFKCGGRKKDLRVR